MALSYKLGFRLLGPLASKRLGQGQLLHSRSKLHTHYQGLSRHSLSQICFPTPPLVGGCISDMAFLTSLIRRLCLAALFSDVLS